MKGFSARNIWRMRAFYLAYTQQVQELSNSVAELDGQNLPQAVAEIPWGHNVLLLEKVKDVQARLWYIHKTLEHGWSRSVLWHHIDTKLYNRQFQPSRAANFQLTLPPAQSDLVREVLKDPYNFDFLTLADDAQEKDLERGLLEHIREFLLELGVGFAFVGNQYHLKVGDEDFYIDLLLRDALPEQLQGSLPTIEQLEAELEAVSVEIDQEE